MHLARMNCRNVLQRDEIAFAVHAADPATRRKSLEMALAGAYSAFIDNEHCFTKGPTDERQLHDFP
jgi:hypothetical protein